MKSLPLIFLLSFGLVADSFAQNCNDVSATCTAVNLSNQGFSPMPDSLAPLVWGVSSSLVIGFKNFDSVLLNGHRVVVHSLKFDTINIIATGLCWQSSQANNIFDSSQSGCFRIFGTSLSVFGQYKLHIVVDIDTGTHVIVNADKLGLHYYLRLINSCYSAPSVDTTQTDSNAIIPYAYIDSCIGGIIENRSSLSSISVSPNPFSNQTIVSFSSLSSGLISERITDLLGNCVYRKTIEVMAGQNSFSVERDNLAPGLYFYSISDGPSTFTARIVISE
jgi:hypothetical protein